MLENYDNIPELRVIINKTQKKLKSLTDYGNGNNSEEVLELSKKLDILIHYYISLELDLKS